MKNIKELGLELIELEDQVLLVEDKRPETGKIAVMIDKSSFIYGKYEVHKGTHERNDQWGTLIASTKPLEVLPLLVIEDEAIGKPLDEYIRTKANQDQCIGFIEGYNKAKETYKFTEEDLRKAIDIARMTLDYDERWGWYSTKNEEEIIQSLTKKELWVEVEQWSLAENVTAKNQNVLKITNNQIKAVWK